MLNLPGSFGSPPILQWQEALLAALFGVSLHLFYYVKGQHETQSVQIAGAHLLLFPAILVTTTVIQGLTVVPLMRPFGIWVVMHLGLFVSMILYRVAFHPLGTMPGPFWAKVSKIPIMVVARRGKLHELHTEWAKKYGPVVRIAPNEVLITSVSGIDIIHGPRSTATKQHTFYDYMQYQDAHDLDSMHDRQEHRARRKVWDLALSNKNMDLYELNARKTIQNWLGKVSAAATVQDPLDLSLYMSLVTFDNMTITGFSMESRAVEIGRKSRLIHLMEVPFARIAASAHSIWPLVIMRKLCLLKEERQFDLLTHETCFTRENNSRDPKDIIKCFLDDFGSDQPRAFHDRRTVYADAQAIMVGGTGTLSALLTHCFYYLAKDPAMRDQLREELTPAFGKSCPGEFAYKDLRSLPCLDSVISETLRMHSPACNNGPRITTEDTLVDDCLLPKDVVVYVGIHSIHRSPKYFVNPDEWKPERWTTQPDLILDKRAYHPFLKGPFSCVGKSLALMVAKLVLSYTIFLYELTFPAGQDASTFLADCKNQVILKPGKLECVFTKLCPS